MRRNSFRHSAVVIVLTTLLLFCMLPASSWSESNIQQQDPASQLPSAAPPESHDPWSEQQRRDMQKKQNLRRQQDIQRDTEKLLELSTELKQYVDKTNENIISMDVIKKADQIEKLAKSIKDKMRGGY